MSRYSLVLGFVILGGGAALGGCSGSDDGGSGPTLSTLAGTVSKDAGPDAEDSFILGIGCEGATLSTGVDPGGQVTVQTCLKRTLPNIPR